MKIAIDISQIAYPGTGVANYTQILVRNLLKYDPHNFYLLFAYSLRNNSVFSEFFRSLSTDRSQADLKTFILPQSLANVIWNRLHLIGLEKLIGKIDVYHSSDWIQIPSEAKKITTVHDLIVYRFPLTSHPSIIRPQKVRLYHVKNDCQHILADSGSTKSDLIEILNINPGLITVVYPGISSEFKKADNIREKIQEEGYIIEDSESGPIIKKEPRE